MSFWRRFASMIFGRPASEDRKVYEIQLLLLFALSTLLYLGFPGTREWRRIAEEEQMQTIIRGWDSLAWYTWLAAAPVMLLLIRRYPLSHGQIRQNLGRILIGSVLIYLVVTHVRYALRVAPELLGHQSKTWVWDVDTYAYNTFAMLPLDFLTYCGFFAVSFSVDYYFKHRQRSEEAVQLQLRTAQLQSALARAELAALRGQLHPHFLFNSFNALATLVRQQKNDA
ncbi:MAG: histidine kinase, partial [Opitutus sp.]